jgi:hypothetical protein
MGIGVFLSFFLSTARKDGRQKWVAAENYHQHHHHFLSQPASQPLACQILHHHESWIIVQAPHSIPF